MNFYFWGHVKQKVLSERIKNVQNFVPQQIQVAEVMITPVIVKNVWRERQYCLDFM